MDAVAGSVVLPGDVLGVVSGDVQLRLGPGVRVEHAKILASKFGVLRFRKPNIYWIDINHKKVILFYFYTNACFRGYVTFFSMLLW